MSWNIGKNTREIALCFMNKKFIPLSDISFYEQVIVVDSYHPDSVALSHWKGAPKIEGIQDDTSTGIVLNALEQDLPELHTYPYVSNNHFDVDGFLGVWSLCRPALAIKHSSLIRKMALIGDFRELSLSNEEDHLALKLVCWINKVEKERFYAPFSSYEAGKNEMKLCVSKYDFFLQQFDKVLQNPEEYRHDWQEEYEQVVSGLEILESPESLVSLIEDIRLLIVRTPEPLHYYALFSKSEPADMVLSMYRNNRYELEYKYTSWVDLAHRKVFPRIDLQPLAQILNQFEESEHLWRADKITDTGPILRLKGKALTKEQRFDHPLYRPIYSSSISPERLVNHIRSFYQEAYAQVEPKTNWNWAETRQINRELFLNKV